MNNSNRIFKSISIFLLGLILGFLIRDLNFGSNATSSTSGSGSIKIEGKENAPVTIVEYSDFQCPLCKKFYDETYPVLQKNYVATGKAKIIFKHFPLSIHPQSPDASVTAECALEQNKFWEMHDLLFQTQSSWSGSATHNDFFKTLAGQLQLNQKQFNECLDQQKYAGNVNKDYQEGVAKAVRGTPTFYINDQIIVGAQDTSVFTDTIDKLLAPKN